ncbi:polynucleotide kinase 3 phosphatase-domain-containing protein [Chiua virens]|nr:polynucleotide kinase 3 phosphatase-domain-containing protein [Chiua virens]
MSEPGPSKLAAVGQPAKKRKTDQLQENDDASDESMDNALKITKIHPFFAKPSGSSPTSFQWLKPALGLKRSCLHGINLAPPARSKIALFDLDGTVIKWNGFGKKRGEAQKWEWWRQSVPSKLKEVHQAGYAVVLVSNQALHATALEEWKKKIPLIGNALPDVPFRLFAACAKDGYRKPMPGVWYELERIFKEQHVEIDRKDAFFVGDAAGRPGDFASTDRKWAINIGIPFYTPEEYFLGLPKAPYKLPGFHISSLPESQSTRPRSAFRTLTCSFQQRVSCRPPTADIVPASSKEQELVLLTGYPMPREIDTLRTRAKCIKAAEEALKAGKSCVIDNTNRDTATRKCYVDLTKKVGVPARCILFEGSMDLAWHNNIYRAYNQASSDRIQPQRDLLPYLAFISYRDNYEEPQTNEGFSEVIKVNWVFEGDEEARRRWSMWLQIDGK